MLSIKDPIRYYLVVLVVGLLVGGCGPGWLSSAFSPSFPEQHFEPPQFAE